jgi:hypothetical protein
VGLKYFSLLFIVGHLKQRKNLGNGPSRYPNYEISQEMPITQLAAKLPLERYNDLMFPIITSQTSKLLAVQISDKSVHCPFLDHKYTTLIKGQFKHVAEAVTYEEMITLQQLTTDVDKHLVWFMTTLSCGIIRLLILQTDF